MNYTETITEIQKANAAAFAAHTELLMSVKQIPERLAIKKTLALMSKNPMQIRDLRIVHYLNFLEHNPSNADINQ